MKKSFLTLSLATAVSIGIAPITANAMDISTAYTYYEYENEYLQDLPGNCQVHIGILVPNGCLDDSAGDLVIPDLSKPETPPASEDTSTDDTTQIPPVSEDTSTDDATELPPSSGDASTDDAAELPPSSEDTESSEDVHPYVLRIVELVNEERAKAGLNPVALDAAASTAAQVRAGEIVTSFSHTRPNGSSFATALKEQGVSYRTSGENIAWGQRSPEAVMEGWMNSSGHRANILKESFTHIGVGYYQENGVNYWTQLFWG